MDLLSFKNYIIDFDGTIFNSIGFWYESPKLYLKQKNIEAKIGLIDRIEVFDTLNTAHILNEEYNLGMTDEETLEDMIKFIVKNYVNLNLCDNALDLIKLLKENNKNVYILTASPRLYVEPAIKKNNLDKYIDGFVSCLDNNTSKSDGTAFINMLKMYNLNINDTLVIDDSKEAIRALNKLNIKSIAVKSDFYGIDMKIKDITLLYEYMPNIYKKFKKI